jgi:leucyl/phenylalanyl-tRNA--protein transferase
MHADTVEAPLEPPPTAWVFPSATELTAVGESAASGDELVAVGGDLEPGTLLAAYRSGLFPMPTTTRGREEPAWWSPDPRGILPLRGLRVSRSLRRSTRRFVVTVDHAFADVVAMCAAPNRPGGWISAAIAKAYGELHRLGWAHSVEAWSADGSLVGGLYGVAIGGLFAGESMFSTADDASKVALVHLVEALRSGGGTLLDVQWSTPHLASLGAIDVPRGDYLQLLADAVARQQLVLGTFDGA